MKNLFDLTHKVALITGASSGMGKAIAEAMGPHGAKIIVSSNDTEGCQKITQLLDSQGVTSLSVPYTAIPHMNFSSR
jgi:NAD(P)-dependent dehydrogenase (short-subunit alcohol dehydrogenase family)